jgi:hypothetical protein
MERPEIVELFYSALVGPNDAEQLFQFLSPSVEWILSAADPQTLGEEVPSNAIRFSGKEGFRQLALYFRDSLRVASRDLTGCITHHQLVFAFGRVRLRTPGIDQPTETNMAAKITFHGSTIIKGQIRISSPLCLIVKRFRPTSYLPVETLYFSLLNDARLERIIASRTG